MLRRKDSSRILYMSAWKCCSGRLLGLILITVLVVLSISPARISAQTPDEKFKQVADEMKGVEEELQATVNEYNAVNDSVGQLRQDIDALKSEIQLKEDELVEFGDRIEGTLYDYYAWEQNGMVNILANSDDINSFYRNQDYLERFLANDYSSFKEVEKLKDELAEKKDELEDMLKQEEVKLEQLAVKKQDVEAKLKDVQERFRQVIAEIGIPEIEGFDWGAIAATSSEKAVKVVAVAAQQLGKPYVFGAAGPDNFDCSGLTQYCYLKGAGIFIDHYTQDQYNAGRKVPFEEARPGDIVCFSKDGSYVHHVGLVIGGGYFIHAPCTGDVVKKQALSTRSDIKAIIRFIED